MADEPRYATYPSLEGRTVLVSGGATGIGAALVEAFHQQGSHVIFIDIDDAAAQTLQTSLGSTSLSYYHCDVTDLPALEATAQQILREHHTIDILVNNAAADTRKGTADVTPAFWDAQVAVNLRHVFFLTQHVVPSMMRAGKGCIVNLGSISWVIPGVGLPCYTTCKAAIVGLTRTHAHEFGEHGVRVNSIMPGAVATEKQLTQVWAPGEQEDMISKQALKQMAILPRHVARLALFLAADDGEGISSQSYRVDGGWT